MARRRSGLSGGKKAVLIIVGLLIAWQFLKLPEVIDAFLTFCLAGVVPGTNIVLSPDTVMRIAGITVGVIIVLFALRPLLRNRFGKKQSTDALEQQDAPFDVADGITEHPETPEITPAEAFRTQTFVSQSTAAIEVEEAAEPATPTWLSRLGGKVYQLLERAMPRILTALVKAGVLAQPKLIRAKYEAGRAWQAIKARAMIDLKWAIAMAKKFWRWLVPYLWQFDGWLEIKVRAIEHRLKHKVERHHTASTVVDLSRHAKLAVSEMDVHTKVKKATTKAKPYAKKAKATAKKAGSHAKKVASKARSRAQKQK